MAYEETEKEEDVETDVSDKKDDDSELEDDNELVVADLDKFATNIADQMSDEQLEHLGAMVVEETKADLESREDMAARWAEWGKLYVGTPDQSDLAQRAGAPNIHTPGSSVAVDQFSSRAEKYLLPPGNVCKADGTGSEDRNRAWRVSKLANVQIEKRIPKFRRTFGTAIKQTSIFGMSALKLWWDHVKGVPTLGLVPAEDFIVSYTHSGPLESAARITHRMRMTRDEIRARVKDKTFHKDAWDLEEEKSDSESDSGLDELRKETDGWQKAEDDPGPMEVYEQHRYLDLDGDGIGEPYIVTVHKGSETVLRIVSRTVKNRAGEEETVNYFTELPFDYNPLGFYSLGIGAKTEGLNKLQNSVANLLLFAALRNSFPPKFVSKKAFKDVGSREYELDEWIEAEMHVDDMQKALYIAPTVQPSPVLMNIYQEAGRQVREVVSVTDVMQGQEQPHNQAATTTKIIQQESMELFNGSFRRMLDALSDMLTKLFQLNRLYLSDEEYVAVLGQTGQPEQAEWEAKQAEWQAITGELQQMLAQGVMPPPEMMMQLQQMGGPPPETWCSVAEDFADTVDLIPTADPNLTTEQERLSQSEATLALVMGGPEPAPPRALWAAKRQRLESLRVPASVIAEVLPEPQEPPPPPNLGPKEALATLLKGEAVAVLPEQAHREYVTEFTSFKATPYWEYILPAGKESVDRHIQERVAAMIEQEAKSEQAQQAQASAAASAGGVQAPPPFGPGAVDMGGPVAGPPLPGGVGADAAGEPLPPGAVVPG